MMKLLLYYRFRETGPLEMIVVDQWRPLDSGISEISYQRTRTTHRKAAATVADKGEESKHRETPRERGVDLRPRNARQRGHRDDPQRPEQAPFPLQC